MKELTQDEKRILARLIRAEFDDDATLLYGAELIELADKLGLDNVDEMRNDFEFLKPF